MNKRLIALVLLIIALAVTAWALPLSRIQDTISASGPWAPIAGAAAGTALLCALVPRTAISFASGALFGAISGGVIASVAAVAAGAATFWIGRALGREAVVAHAGRRLARMDAWLARRGLLGVTVVRLMPIGPYGLVGYAYGTTSVRWWNYFGGTAIAEAPSAFAYAALGAAVVKPGAIGWLTLIPAFIGLAVAGAAFVYWRRTGRPSAARPDDLPR